MHFNLMISLGLVQIAFLSATATTSNKVSRYDQNRKVRRKFNKREIYLPISSIITLAPIFVCYFFQLSCKIVALILHYLFVVSFVWMFIEGIILYLKVIMAFNGENVRMGKFIVLGWGM